MEPQSSSPPWPLKDADDLRDELIADYSAPGRHFHDTRHLADLLAALDDLERAGNEFDPLVVELAAWFRRSVYDGERDDDERAAVRAEDRLFGTVAPATVREVARLIRATETLLPEPGDANVIALSDAVLAVLKSPAERYADYVSDVRREYPHLSDDEFDAGRAIVVEGLLARERIFHSEHGVEAWESAARANLSRELAGLRRHAAAQ